MQETYSNMLTTPIRRIKELSIHSPDDDPNGPSYGFLSSVTKPTHHPQANEQLSLSRQESISPIRYPSMSDFCVQPVPLEQISQTMLDRGYSRTLSNKVLRELDSRANEISRQISSGNCSSTRPSSAKLKRYSQFHKPIFQKMESISSHYAASRSESTTSRSSDLLSSASKKRRTLNGPEEIFAAEKENESPIRRKDPNQNRQTPFLGAVPALLADSSRPTQLLSSPYRDLDASPYVPVQVESSPTRTLDPASQASSPTKFSKISPSKGSMNLNRLLLDDSGFVKPEGPVKIRQSSLQMAGVVPTTGLSGIPQLQKKPSMNLQKKASSASLQSSTSSLHKKPSVGNLQRPSIQTLQFKTFPKSESSTRVVNKSEPSSLHKETIPSLQKKPLTSLLYNRTSSAPDQTAPSLNKKPLQTSLNRSSHLQSSTLPSPKPSTTRHVYHSLPTSSSQKSSMSQYGKLLDPSLNASPSNLSILSMRSNITIPKPFSLYNKPTISSSQKSFGAMQSSASLRSLALNLGSKSTLGKHQPYKGSFA